MTPFQLFLQIAEGNIPYTSRSTPQSLEVVSYSLKFLMGRSKNVPEGLLEIVAGGGDLKLLQLCP